MELNVNLFIKLTSGNSLHSMLLFHTVIDSTLCLCVCMRCLPLTDGFDIWICEASAMRLFTWIHTHTIFAHSFVHSFVRSFQSMWSDCVRPWNIEDEQQQQQEKVRQQPEEKNYTRTTPIIKLDFKRASVTRSVEKETMFIWRDIKQSKNKIHHVKCIQWD